MIAIVTIPLNILDRFHKSARRLNPDFIGITCFEDRTKK